MAKNKKKNNKGASTTNRNRRQDASQRNGSYDDSYRYDEYDDYSRQYSDTRRGEEDDWEGWYDHGYTSRKQTKANRGKGRGDTRGYTDQWANEDYYDEWNGYRDYRYEEDYRENDDMRRRRSASMTRNREDYRNTFGEEEDTRGWRGASRGRRDYGDTYGGEEEDRREWRGASRERENYEDTYGEEEDRRGWRGASRGREDYRDPSRGREDTRGRRGPSRNREDYGGIPRDQDDTLRRRSNSKGREDYRGDSRRRDNNRSPSRDSARNRSPRGDNRKRSASGQRSQRIEDENFEEGRYNRYERYSRVEPPPPPLPEATSGAPPPHPHGRKKYNGRTGSSKLNWRNAPPPVPGAGAHAEPLQGPSPISSMHSSPVPIIEPPAPPPPPPPPPALHHGPSRQDYSSDLGYNGNARGLPRSDLEHGQQHYHSGSPSAAHDDYDRHDIPGTNHSSQRNKRQRVGDAIPRGVSGDSRSYSGSQEAAVDSGQGDMSPVSAISGTDGLDGGVRTITYTRDITFKATFRQVGRADVEPTMPEPARIESRANLEKMKGWWPPRKTRAYMALDPSGDEDREAYKKCVKDLMKRNRAGVIFAGDDRNIWHLLPPLKKLEDDRVIPKEAKNKLFGVFGKKATSM